MGWAARANPSTREPQAVRRLRRLLALFPDRATYERWLTARGVPEANRAHMEQFLPAHLTEQGSV